MDFEYSLEHYPRYAFFLSMTIISVIRQTFHFLFQSLFIFHFLFFKFLSDFFQFSGSFLCLSN